MVLKVVIGREGLSKLGPVSEPNQASLFPHITQLDGDNYAIVTTPPLLVSGRDLIFARSCDCAPSLFAPLIYLGPGSFVTMSLFGDDDLPSRPKQSALFDDDPKPAGKTGSGLFSDDYNDSGDSPWAFPTPKKAARGALIKTLLPVSDVPDSYIDAYDTLLESGHRMGAGVSLAGIKKLLEDSALPADSQSRILDIVAQPGQDSTTGFGRGEFNVLFALIGLAQEGEEVTLDGVDERKRSTFEITLTFTTMYVNLTHRARPPCALNISSKTGAKIKTCRRYSSPSTTYSSTTTNPALGDPKSVSCHAQGILQL